MTISRDDSVGADRGDSPGLLVLTEHPDCPESLALVDDSVDSSYIVLAQWGSVEGGFNIAACEGKCQLVKVPVGWNVSSIVPFRCLVAVVDQSVNCDEICSGRIAGDQRTALN